MASNCDQPESGSNSNLGHCYRSGTSPITTVERARSLLGGEAIFRVEDIEVFTLRT